MKLFSTIWNWLLFLFTGKGPVAEQAVKEGLLDLSGEGRDETGK